MAAVHNPYDLLKNRMEPEQLLQEAKSKKKKKSKAKAIVGAEAGQPQLEQRARSAIETDEPPAEEQPPQNRREPSRSANERRARNDEDNMALEEACPALLRVATKDGRMSVWNDWILQVEAGDRSVLYRAPDGSLVNFHKALLDSGAFETTVAHCMRVPLQRNEQPVLAALLSCCLPGVRPAASDLTAAVYALSAAMRDSRRDVQDAAVGAVKALMAALKAALAAQPPTPEGPSVADIDRQLAAKHARLERALASTSDLPQEAATNAVQVAQLLARKFAAVTAGGGAPTAAAAAEMARLTGVLGQCLEASQGGAGGRAPQGAHLQEIVYLDTKIESLSARVKMLEADLQHLRGELQQHVQRRASLKHGQAAPTNGKSAAGGASAAAYRQQLDCVAALEAAVALAAGAPLPAGPDGGDAGTVDATLQELVLTCVQAAQIQDKFMESLMNQLHFARERLQQVERLRTLNVASGSGKGADDARAMIEAIKRQSQSTHDAAVELDCIVAQQEGAIRPSAKDSVLRSQAMQVKQIVNQVIMQHHHLLQQAEAPLPFQQAQAGATAGVTAPQQWQLDDILRMNVGSKGSNSLPPSQDPRAADPVRAAPPPAQLQPPVAQPPMAPRPAMAPVGAPPAAVQPMLAQYLPAGMPLAHAAPVGVAPPAPQPAAAAPLPPPAVTPADEAAQRSLDSAQQSLARLQASLGISIDSAAAPGPRTGGRAGRGRGRGGRV